MLCFFMQLKTVGESLNVIRTINSTLKATSELRSIVGGEAVQTQKLAIALNGYSTEAIKAAIAQSSLSAEQIKAILSAKGLTEAEIEEVIATNALSASQTGATASTLGLGTAIKGLGASIKAFALSNPILTAIAAAGITIYGAVKAFDALTVSVEEATEATEEAIQSYQSITSEVENLKSKISDLSNQISQLDPITNEEDIRNLKLETEELNTQLAILKEKQRIAQADADKAAQESLGMTQPSKYKLSEHESAYGGIEVTAAYVTKDEELLNAMEAYSEYKSKVDDANNALADMAKTGEYTQKEWRQQEQIVTKYSEKMEEARSHTNELAIALNEQKQGLSGNTDASRNLLNTIDNTITAYDEWLNKINGVADGLNKQADAAGNVESVTSSFDLPDYEEQIDNIQSSLSKLRDALDAFNKGTLDEATVLDLMQQFPSLVPYIDLTADGFGNLSEGLSELISQQPDSLIQSLQTLKESLSTDEEREQVELLIDQLQRLSSYGDSGIEAYATTIGNTWSDTSNVIEGVTTQFENLAKVQEYVAKGLTMSATAAAELANMYPEILTNAQVSANGQITLNEEVVKNILDGDKSIVEAQITKLEADEAGLIAKKNYAEAQLDIVKQTAEGEGKRYCPLP